MYDILGIGIFDGGHYRGESEREELSKTDDLLRIRYILLRFSVQRDVQTEAISSQERERKG